MATQWQPDWSEEEIKQASQKVGQNLRHGLYGKKIREAQKRCRGKSWWDRQFDILARGAYSSLKEFDKRINQFSQDTPRVLRLIQDHWHEYSRLVSTRHGEETLAEIVDIAKESPSDLYVYLVTVHVQKPWFTHKPGYEASVQTAWSKIGADNQLLWSMSEFKKVFI